MCQGTSGFVNVFQLYPILTLWRRAKGLIWVGRTAQLTSRRCILNTYSTNIRTEYFKHATSSPFFSVQNSIYFIILPRLVSVLFKF
jgi:hypothetical protein